MTIPMIIRARRPQDRLFHAAAGCQVHRKGRKMRFVLFLLVFMLVTPAYAQYDKAWRYCEADSDCVIVGGGCCMIAVNKDFTSQGEAYCADVNTRAECEKPVDLNDASVSCRKASVPCLGSTEESCLSKRAKCTLSDHVLEE